MTEIEAEFDAMVEEILQHLSQAVEGYDLTLPLRAGFGARWDLRARIAWAPARSRAVGPWDEFFLVTLVGEDGPAFVKRCDSPPEVLREVYGLIAGDLDPVPGADTVRMCVADGDEAQPAWQWGHAPAGDALPGRVTLADPRR